MRVRVGFDDEVYGVVTSEGGKLSYEGKNPASVRRLVEHYAETLMIEKPGVDPTPDDVLACMCRHMAGKRNWAQDVTSEGDKEPSG